MFDYDKLRGRIKEILGSEKEYANKMGMSQQTTSSKLNGETSFTDKQIYQTCEILKINLDYIPLYFFKVKTELNSVKK